jgi:plastocyanin
MRILGLVRLGAIAALAISIGATASEVRPASTYRIVIDKMAFGAAPAELREGDTILWVNRDMFRHTVTAKDRSFDIDLLPGESATLVLKRAGMISFFCKFHPDMKGVLTIVR